MVILFIPNLKLRLSTHNGNGNYVAIASQSDPCSHITATHSEITWTARNSIHSISLYHLSPDSNPSLSAG